MVAKIRQQRIAERIKEEVSQMLLGQLTDPRLLNVTVTDVTVDRELAYATIFVSSFSNPEEKKDILAGLESARGFMRYHLSQQIDLRSFPQLRFKWDSTPQRVARIDELFDTIASQETPPSEEASATKDDV